jgi:hypothetical protein
MADHDDRRDGRLELDDVAGRLERFAAHSR